MSKTDLWIRPIYSWPQHRIQAHFIIAFCRYKLYKELEGAVRRETTEPKPEKAVQNYLLCFSALSIAAAFNKHSSYSFSASE